MSDINFTQELTRELARSRLNNFRDNFDRMQQGEEPPPLHSAVWKESIVELSREVRKLANIIITPLKPFIRPVRRALYFYCMPERFYTAEAKKFENFTFLHILLGNKASKDLLVKLCAFRLLGHRKVKLPRNQPQYWQDIDTVVNYRTSEPPVKISFLDASLALYDFTPLGYDAKVYASGTGCINAFMQKQYEYHVDHVHCKAEAGDVVIDAGGCWGEVTMYFAHEVGPQGKVVAFEFIPSNLAVMEANISKNPKLAERLVVIKKPVWSHSGLKLYYTDWGPGSRVTEDPNQYKYDGTCETISIDDMVAEQGLQKVDFIKMDIEGAELSALRGAEKTIRKFRPKLAISLYHQLSDFVTIPRFLYELNLEYDFYLDHHTLYENETVLFAIPSTRGHEIKAGVNA